MRTKHPLPPIGRPSNHPAPDLLASYAAGALAIGPAVVVGAHLDGCASCRAVGAFEEAEAGRMMSLEDTAFRPGAMQAMMDRLDDPLPVQASRTDVALALLDGIRLPEMLAEIGFAPPIHLSADVWVAHLDAPRMDGWRTYVFSAPPKTALPTHSHRQDELIAILHGGFYDGKLFETGDFAVNGPGSSHQMTASPDHRFVALVASGSPLEWQPDDAPIGHLLDI